MIKLKKTWFISIVFFIFSVLGVTMLLQKEAAAAGEYTIWAELSTLTYEQKNFDIPLAASKLLVFASNSEGNMLSDNQISITKIEKKQVSIDRTKSQYGSISYTGHTDITSTYKNADVIEDANGIYTITYAVNGSSPSVKVVVQAGDFSAPEIYKAGDDATPSARNGVKANSQITYDTTGVAGYLRAGDKSAVTFGSFDVWENGIQTVTSGTMGNFTVAEDGTYKVHATASDSYGNVTKFPMILQDQYLAVEDFEERVAGNPTTWASQDTLLVQNYNSAKIIADANDNKQLKIESPSTKWPMANLFNNVRYDGFVCNYGLGLFDLPISTAHEYKATFDVTIQATYSDTAEGQTVYIGYPFKTNTYDANYWATVTLDADGTYTGEVTIPQVMISALGNAGGEPNYSAATAKIWFMFKDATGTNAIVTIDNMQLIPLVSEKNAIISSLETMTHTVNIGETFSLLPEAYGLVATDFRGLELASMDLEVKEGNPESAVTIDIAEGVTELSSDVGTYYQLIYTLTDYYGNTKVETVGVSVGAIEYDVPIITADSNIMLAKDTEVSFGTTPNKYFTVEEESNYTLKYTVEKNGVVEQTDVETYSFTFADTDSYKVTITATDQWGASTSKTIVFNYAGAYNVDFEEREVGTTPSWAGNNTLLIQNFDTAQIISENNNKKLKISSPKVKADESDGWPMASILNGVRCDGIGIRCGLGLFDLPLDTSLSYQAVLDVDIKATYSETAEGQMVYIGYPFKADTYDASCWARVTLDAEGQFSGQVVIPQVYLHTMAGSAPYYYDAAARINFLFKNATGINAEVTIDNIRLIPVTDEEQSNEQVLATGATVSFDKQGTVLGINGNGFETFTYTVERNNEVVAKDVESYTIESMVATDYYEVWVNATDKFGNSESKYMLFVGESVNINTFTTLIGKTLNWSDGFVLKYNSTDMSGASTAGAQATKEVYTDASGNAKLRFVISEEENLKGHLDLYLTCHYFNFGTPFDITLTDQQYDTYLDLSVKVKLKDGVTVPTIRMGNVSFNLEKTSDGWATYSGTLVNYDYSMSSITDTIKAFRTQIVMGDYSNVTEMIVEIDNMRWVDLR